MVRLPFSCPWVKGLDILEGLITSPDVVASLEDYHPRAGAWARVRASFSVNSNLSKKDVDFLNIL